MLKITSESPNMGVVNGGSVSGELVKWLQRWLSLSLQACLRFYQSHVPLNGIG